MSGCCGQRKSSAISLFRTSEPVADCEPDDHEGKYREKSAVSDLAKQKRKHRYYENESRNDNE